MKKKKRKTIKHEDLNLKELEDMGQTTLFELEAYLSSGGGNNPPVEQEKLITLERER